ncbi:MULTISPECIES: tRNA preQ1(34) S-adenosylmethionine ribosyltransferase-isomerase QueA [Caulobacter]|jgi:S-adenosylmethionine:tRNA ribosyltransferase-isomerase|uniref:S-adenosylmethionine:tRNA ribosyltransferase-isomerase n=1 Tax=Caulobacter vibrioides OR37 TaxID=1292034 RepID=R0CYR1_CAUVI|nr:MULTISPECIES: tRNA preQ1(34) S-adenosylmethionine ribosyltransferase-isomerase QueA [Caulobacter]ENZ81420.1 S-adenosylmethionine:tRNA ribosyltransferase-isomerase [Caulobacter vibrioides OR37]MBQ1560673.1 tRNA preQ1(34) S-adenosylmethionine ribosyltransferase-isomerase QueA [Caulobacter sp.]
MRLSDFDFDLPEDRIALRPAEPRDAARLLVVRPGHPLADQVVRQLPDFLRPGDALVFNDTRVIPARLSGLREGRATGGGDGAPVAVEATLHRRLAPDRWSAFMRPGKRLKIGDRVSFGAREDRVRALDSLDATIAEKHEGGEVVLAFDLSGPDLDIGIARHGDMPLPPYIAAKRGEDERDRSDYQTVYAREDGSVAAPTAGLHFTPDLLEALKQKGVSLHFVTLHVGAGTFLPVKTDDVSEHRMHAEFGQVTAEVADALNAVRAAGGRIVCVGTTSLRLLESATGEDGVVRPFADETAIFITPGYRFRAADVLMTNFHLPKSTLFMLVSAFAGSATMRAAYQHAIATGYRFYSYGDGSLLFKDETS